MRLATPAARLLTLALAGFQIVANLILRLLERTGLPRAIVLALVQLPAIARTPTGKAGAPAL